MEKIIVWWKENNRGITLVKALLLASLPVLCCLVYCAAQGYAKDFKLHELKYPKSIVTFLICNKEKTTQTEWYRQQKEAMRLMEEKGQTYLDESFSIFAQRHIENLKELETRRETA